MSMLIDTAARLTAMPVDLVDSGWRLHRNGQSNPSFPYIAKNERLRLETDPYGSAHEAIARASVMEEEHEQKLEEEERAAIAADGATTDPTPADDDREPVPPGERLMLLESIRIDGGTQPRESLDMTVVVDYKESMLAGANFPPVEVFFDGEDAWLADGFHRYRASEEAGFTEILARIREGSRRDAVLYSLGANATHGLPRSNEDKRRAARTMLLDPEWSTFSDNVIAQKVNVSQPFVSKLRRELSQNVLSEQPTAREGADGVVRETKNIGKAPEEDLRQATLADIDGVELPASEPEEGLDNQQPQESSSLFAENGDENNEHELGDDPSDMIVQALSRHGGVLTRTQLEEIGFTYVAILEALAEGVIAQPETGKFTLPDHKPQGQPVANVPASSPAPARTISAEEETDPAGWLDQSLAINLSVKPGKSARRGITISGRVGEGKPVFRSDFTVADLEPMPPALRELVNDLKRAFGGGAKAAPRTSPKAPTKKAAPAKKKQPAKAATKKRTTTKARRRK